MNYLLHNLGYDKPINFREIVLRTYKNQCWWLRDAYFSRLSLTDYKQWLPNLEYYENSLREEKERLEMYQNELTALTEEKIQEMYAEEADRINGLHNCNNSYHIDVATKIKRCTDEYNNSLQKWLDITGTPKFLTDTLVDIYETAIEDMKKHEKDNVEAVARMHNQKVPDYDHFKADTIKRAKDMIEFYRGKISASTKAIKRIKEEIEEVKQVFAWLDSIEQKESAND